MTLILGSITDENKKAISHKYPAIWIEPAQNKSLFEINYIINEFGDVTDSESLVIWTNHPMLIEYLFQRASSVIHVEDAKLFNSFRQHIEEKYSRMAITEIVTRNWHFEETDKVKEEYND